MGKRAMNKLWLCLLVTGCHTNAILPQTDQDRCEFAGGIWSATAKSEWSVVTDSPGSTRLIHRMTPGCMSVAK